MLFLSGFHSSMVLLHTQLCSKTLIWALYLCAIIFSLLPTIASASDAYNRGVYYFANGDYLSAVSIWAHKLLLMPAEEGSALAQFLLAEIYFSGGDGIERNQAQAGKWYQLAQQSGYPDAQKRLHNMTLNKQTLKPELLPVSTAKESSDARLLNDASRYAQLDNNLFSLQILQARQYNSISQLTRQFSDDNTYFFKIGQGNEALFVLIYGHYASYGKAKNAIASLPEPFQLKSAPWIRKVNSIQSLIP